MRWFRRHDTDAATALAEEEPREHRSPALQALLEGLVPGGTYAFLDLGSARGDNLSFFTPYAGRLEVADLWGSLVGDDAAALAFSEHPDEVLAGLLPGGGAAFDVVLAWDLFNYLDRPQLRALGRHLARLCRTGGQLLAFVSAEATVPARPIAYRVAAADRLVYDIRAPESRPAPRFTPAEVETYLAGFSVDRSFLLRHRVQEYLLVRDEDEEAGDQG